MRAGATDIPREEKSPSSRAASADDGRPFREAPAAAATTFESAADTYGGGRRSLHWERAKRFVKDAVAISRLSDRTTNAVLLTFDDGPHPEITPAVLRLLKRHQARAVFFVVGSRVDEAPHLLPEIVQQGHAIGNHSYSHPNERQPWLVPYVRDVLRCQQQVERLTGLAPRLFRPPLGKLTPASVVAPKLLGLRTVLWSAAPGYWSLWDQEESVALAEARRFTDALCAQRTRNDIVLLHDDHPQVVTVLETLLPRLAAVDCDLHHPLDSIRRERGSAAIFRSGDG